jgi:protein-tyrosine phosphatase
MGFFSTLFGSKESKIPFDLASLKTDMHSHLIPGIDDGSKSLDESIAMLTKFKELGYSKVITTPHIYNEVYPNTPEIILSGLENVRQELQRINLHIELEAAAEYYCDDLLLEKIKEKSLLTFGDNYVLVEFSFNTAPQFDEVVFFEMLAAGYKPILAHFERYVYYHGSVDKAYEWREKGVDIQLNLNSLIGHYGPGIKKQAEALVNSGQVDFVGTDCHRMEHLTLLEQNLSSSYFHKLDGLKLKNARL